LTKFAKITGIVAVELYNFSGITLKTEVEVCPGQKGSKLLV
jgi:hypothetical protein